MVLANQLGIGRQYAAVIIIGDKFFAAAPHRPVKPVGRAVKATKTVRGGDAVTIRARIVIGNGRGATHATRARAISPSAARLNQHVQTFLHQHNITRRAGRCFGLQEIENGNIVEIFGRILLRVRPAQNRVIMHGYLVIIAALIDRNGGELALQFVAAIAQRMVPHHLQAIIWNREGRGHNRFGDAIAIGHQFPNSGIARRRLINMRGLGTRAPRRINIQEIAVMARHQRLLAARDKGVILRRIGPIDAKQRCVCRKRVGQMFALLIANALRWAGHPAGPCRYRAIGIATALTAQRRQVFLQPLNLFRRH